MITILTSVLTVEQARGREEQLTKDLARSVQRIRVITDNSPTGMYDLSAEGVLVWANDHFLSLVGSVQPTKYSELSW